MSSGDSTRRVVTCCSFVSQSRRAHSMLLGIRVPGVVLWISSLGGSASSSLGEDKRKG